MNKHGFGSIVAITSVTYEFSLMHHWFAYYHSLGVDKFIVAVGDFINPNLPNSFKEEFRDIKNLKVVRVSERFRRTGYEGDDKEEIRKRYCRRHDWIIPADPDEFVQFPDKLTSIIAQMQIKRCNHVVGYLVDRIAQDGQLTQDVKNKSLWEQYPLEVDISQRLVKCWCRKLVFVRGNVPLGAGAHYIKERRNNFFFKNRLLRDDCNVHHFKWRASLREALERRVSYYEKANIPSLPESRRVLDYIKLKGRIVPEEFNARPGWVPEAEQVLDIA